MQRAALETFNIVLQVLCKTAGCQTQVLQLSHQSPGKNPFCIEKEKNTSKQESWAEPAQPQQCPCHYTTDWSCATNSLAQAVLPFHKAFHSKKKEQFSGLCPYIEKGITKKLPLPSCPSTESTEGFGHHGCSGDLPPQGTLLQLSCHTQFVTQDWKPTNFLTKKTVGKSPSDLELFSSRSSKQAVSKYTKTWAFKTAQPLTFGVFWFSVNKQPNDSNPSGPAGLGSCWDQICRPLSPFCHYPKRCWVSPISHGGELENLYNSNT